MTRLRNVTQSRLFSRVAALFTFTGLILGGPIVASPCPEDLPVQAGMSASPGSASYMNVTVFNGGTLNGVWPGWCLQAEVDIFAGVNYEPVWVFCSTGIVPSSSVDHPENLGAVNWILNQILVGNGYSVGDVQTAIWRLVDNEHAQGRIAYNEANVAWLVDQALQNNDFIPPSGGGHGGAGTPMITG